MMTTFNSQLENASVMLDACRSEFARQGMDGVDQLKGLEITDPVSAELAYQSLLGIPAEGTSLEVKKATLEVLRSAMRTREPRLAS
jgi:hypothetical protein